MSEWKIHGNPSKRFPAFMMSPPIQEQADKEVATERLREFLPENCRSCLRARAGIINTMAHKVVKDEVSKEAAIEEVVHYSADCTGPVKDSYGFVVGCPSRDKSEQEEMNHGNI